MNLLKRNKKGVKPKRKRTPTELKIFRRRIYIAILVFILIVLVFLGIYHGSRVEGKQITGVEVIGGKTIAHSEIEKVVNETLVGDYYRLIPRTFIWTYPKNQIEENLLKNDRIKNVRVELNQQDQVVVVFEEHIPEALWCDIAGEKCLFLDHTSLAFATAPALSGGAFVRYSEANRDPEKGMVAFAPEYIESNEEFIEQLESELGLFVTEVIKVGDYDVEYVVSGGGRIKTSQTMDLDKTFRNLKTILQSEQFVHLEPGKFKYIDLRFGDKVFVNEETEPAEVATTTDGTMSTETE